MRSLSRRGLSWRTVFWAQGRALPYPSFRAAGDRSIGEVEPLVQDVLALRFTQDQWPAGDVRGTRARVR